MCNKTKQIMTQVTITDGGRSKYFKAQRVDDCVVRSLAIASQTDYKQMYLQVKKLIGYSPRNGIQRRDINKIMKHFKYKWVPTMFIGQGCKTHLKESELPKGRIICNCSRHLVAVIDGVVHDSYDSTRNGKRCVYGYWVVE